MDKIEYQQFDRRGTLNIKEEQKHFADKRESVVASIQKGVGSNSQNVTESLQGIELERHAMQANFTCSSYIE